MHGTLTMAQVFPSDSLQYVARCTLFALFNISITYLPVSITRLNWQCPLIFSYQLSSWLYCSATGPWLTSTMVTFLADDFQPTEMWIFKLTNIRRIRTLLLRKVSYIKYLVVTDDHKLFWNEHIQKIVNKTAQVNTFCIRIYYIIRHGFMIIKCTCFMNMVHSISYWVCLTRLEPLYHHQHLQTWSHPESCSQILF